MTYALGRGVEPYDQPAVDRIVADLRKDNAKFSTLIVGIIRSTPFQMRRGDSPAHADSPDVTMKSLTARADAPAAAPGDARP
jgi:hypothetical protein